MGGGYPRSRGRSMAASHASRVLVPPAASVAAHERRIAGLLAHRPARPMSLLGSTSSRLLLKGAAIRGGSNSRGQVSGPALAAAISIGRRSKRPVVNGGVGSAYCGAANERCVRGLSSGGRLLVWLALIVRCTDDLVFIFRVFVCNHIGVSIVQLSTVDATECIQRAF